MVQIEAWGKVLGERKTQNRVRTGAELLKNAHRSKNQTEKLTDRAAFSDAAKDSWRKKDLNRVELERESK